MDFHVTSDLQMSTQRDTADLENVFQKWNPMQEAYADVKFNTYKSGPGAYLDAELQTSAKTHKANVQKPYLLFRNTPKEMTKNVLSNMCKHHGRIVDVRYNQNNKIYFVDCATVADMEAIFRGLSENEYGFTVCIGKYTKKDNNDGPNYVEQVPEPQTKQSVKEIDLDNRNIYVPEKQPLRRNPIARKSVPKIEDYELDNSLLQKNDPKRQLLHCAEDAHELERIGVLADKLNTITPKNQMQNYCNGRVYIDVPDGISNYMQKKFGKSSGEIKNNGEELIVVSKEFKENAIDLGKCANCNVICNLACARCDTYYCGIKCQTQAWPKHRYTCGKPAALNYKKEEEPKEYAESVCSSAISSSSSGNKSQLVQSFPRSGSIVEMTSINKTNIVFVRSKTYEANINYFKTLTEVQKAAKALGEPLQSAPKCGQIVLTEFKGKYNRAIVMGTNEEHKVKLNYLDYGNTDVKDISELYAAPEILSKMPRLTQPVLLKGVPDCYMNDEIRAYMYKYLAVNLVIKYAEDADYNVKSGVYEVVLIDEDHKHNINEHIIQLTHLKQPENDFEFYHINNLKVVDLPTGANIEYVVMDNTMLNVGFVSCTTKAFALEIQKFQNEIQRYAASNEKKTYCPRVSELCIVQFAGDELWYRGRCVELIGDGFPSIEFIDFGNIACVSVEKILRMPKEFIFPLFTHSCEIDGLPIKDINEKLVARLEDLIPIYSFITCDNVEYNKELELYTIVLHKVIKTLKEEKLLDEMDLK